MLNRCLRPVRRLAIRRADGFAFTRRLPHHGNAHGAVVGGSMGSKIKYISELARLLERDDL
jgi:hypothetical protein